MPVTVDLDPQPPESPDLYLIRQLRQLVGAGTAEYTINAVAYWTDEQLEAALDANRLRHDLARVDPVWDIDETGQHVVLRGHVLAAGVFEPGQFGALKTREGVLLDGWTVDDRGLVEYGQDLAAQVVYWTGWTYDLHAAAASVLDSWAAAVKLHYDVSTDGQAMSRSQKLKHLTELAKDHRRRQLPGSVPLPSGWDRPQPRRIGW